MQTVYVVFSDYGDFLEEIFSTREKAENFIKNIDKADYERKSNNETWEEYLSNDSYNAYLSIVEYDLQ